MSSRACGISGSSMILLEENVGLNAPQDSVMFPKLSEIANPGAILLNSILTFVISQWFAISPFSTALHHSVSCC